MTVDATKCWPRAREKTRLLAERREKPAETGKRKMRHINYFEKDPRQEGDLSLTGQCIVQLLNNRVYLGYNASKLTSKQRKDSMKNYVEWIDNKKSYI
jgi:hypothetical protein